MQKLECFSHSLYCCWNN